MKIAVCAASGQLGSAIVKNLLQEVDASQIVALARTPEKAANLGVEVRKGDYTQKGDFDSALKDIDAVLLLSANGEPMARIPQHRNVIEAAKEAGVKKIVYTSVGGNFGPVVKSNHQTEEDIKTSGMQYAIGRNGIYIEPDLEYIDTYVKEGRIENCAGQGKCTYTSREELGYAYAKILIEDKHNGNVYNLVGEPVTQSELAENINKVYGTDLIYNSVTVESYAAERKAALGDFLGTVIAGIYEGIKSGANNVPSDYEKATGRAPKSLFEMISEFKNNH